ncbi:Putative uncharacterized protein [Taphrina deformans PYCC 5710]|uniref:Nuclear cap-binding protein subunit 3 n=1 Tax=Taphrina deformans (strain PYCC 5710 / ATCC 11124 / CBS 356.35 / IMI 108563 / JCM 9778 / NBRC 8474) TaxID=1097556 RepID=R4X9K9_TAPDE|nr:Putative uncharacterized protein [Taphrina deformans PYCC 5710]|eukprot:CCG80919.1 Putative uncharacterized protein [Taphrina deformans PYCC 5710]
MELDADMYDDNNNGSVTKDEKNQDAREEPPANAPRDNAIHLRGTDDMSTSDVHKYLSLYTTESKPRIEWIDDTSLNLVYYTAEDARIALAHLTSVSTDQIDSQTLSPAQANPEKPDARLTIRFATTSDKKERGAKDRSRWYLFHPEDDPDSRPRQRRTRDGPYSTAGRHEKRVAKGTPGGADLFAARLGEVSGFKSEHASMGPKSDLFEEKVAKKEPVAGEDLFASRVQEAAKSSQRPKSHLKDDRNLPANDLFARVGTSDNSGLSLADRISGSRSRGTDLFPGRAADATGALRDRISGGPIRNKGMSIRGAGHRAKASDLF